MKSILIYASFFMLSTVIVSSCSSGEEKKEKTEEKTDSVATDEAEMPEVEDIEMDFMYEITNTKTKKTVTMTQEEYLESGVWENPDVTIKEIPVVK